jgi:hypothetical protein
LQCAGNKEETAQPEPEEKIVEIAVIRETDAATNPTENEQHNEHA